MGGVFNAIGGFLSSPAGKVVTAVVTDAIAVVTLNPFAIVAAVGATLGAIGAVTGNQTISTIGTVIGAVGAVGGLANAAGLLDISDVFGQGVADWTHANALIGGAGATGGSGGVATDTGSFGVSGGPTTGYDFADNSGAFGGLGSGGQPPSVFSGIASQLQDVTPTVDTASAPSVAPTVATDGTMGTASGSASATPDTFGTPTGTNTPDPTNPGAPAATDQVPSAPPTSSVANPPSAAPATGAANRLDAGIPGSYAADQNAVNTYGAVPTAPVTGVPTMGSINNPNLITAGQGTNAAGITVAPKAASTFGDIEDWITGHPSLALGALMAGGSFLSGATSPLTPAQVAALNAQAQMNQAAANLSAQQTQLLQRQQANMSQPLPVASRTPTGLINTPQLAPVTGHPA